MCTIYTVHTEFERLPLHTIGRRAKAFHNCSIPLTVWTRRIQYSEVISKYTFITHQFINQLYKKCKEFIKSFKLLY